MNLELLDFKGYRVKQIRKKATFSCLSLVVNVDSFDFICPGFEISISEFLLPPKYRGGEWIFVCGVHLTEELQLNKIY